MSAGSRGSTEGEESIVSAHLRAVALRAELDQQEDAAQRAAHCWWGGAARRQRRRSGSDDELACVELIGAGQDRPIGIMRKHADDDGGNGCSASEIPKRQKRSITWDASVTQGAEQAHPGGDGDANSKNDAQNTRTITVRRLSFAQKQQLYRDRPDLAIVPDWVSRYRNEQAADMARPSRCFCTLVAFVTLGLITLLVIVLLRNHMPLGGWNTAVHDAQHAAQRAGVGHGYGHAHSYHEVVTAHAHTHSRAQRNGIGRVGSVGAQGHVHMRGGRTKGTPLHSFPPSHAMIMPEPPP